MQRKIIITFNFTYIAKAGGVVDFAENLKNGFITLGLTNTMFVYPPQSYNKTKKLMRFIREPMTELVNIIEQSTVIYPNYAFIPIPFKNLKRIVVIHDLQFIHFPKYFSLTKKLVLDIFMRNAKVHADGVVFISDATAGDFIAAYGQPKRYKTIYNPIMIDTSLPSSDVEKGEEYIIGNMHYYPHKRIDLLLKWFIKFKVLRPNFRLYLTGHGSERILSMASELGAKDVEHLGFLPKSELIPAIRRARAYASFSEFEGFNMAAAEAALLKIPVILSPIPVHRELFCDYALFVDPENEDDIYRAVEYIDQPATLRSWQHEEKTRPSMVASAYRDFSEEIWNLG